MIIGRLVRMQLGNSLGWWNISRERNCTLQVTTEWAEGAGGGRGVKHTKKRSRWTANATVLVDSSADFKDLWEEFSALDGPMKCRMVTTSQRYEGKALISSLSIRAGQRGFAEVNLEFTGTGRLTEI